MRLTRARLAVTAMAAFGAAAAIAAGSLAGGASAAASAAPATTSYVLVNCAGHGQTRPSSFVLTCGDGNWGYLHMRWQAWGATAYATATSQINDCNPNCAEGKLYYFPTLIVAWRPEPRPGHSGERYYTRLGWIFQDQACLPSPPKGQVSCLPQTGTYPLIDSK